MSIGISPTVDFAFKLLFGSPEHSSVTIHFLNAILGRVLRITAIEIQNPLLNKDSQDDKFSVLDILATDEHGRILNIEMQTTLPAGMSQRLSYYTARLYADQMNEGDPYTALRPAISICVLTKAMFPDITGLHLDFRMRESSGALFTDDLQIHLLELSKLDVTAQNLAEASVIEQWAYFMLNAERLTLEDIQIMFPDREFTEAAGVLEMISKTPEQQKVYDARLKFQRDQAGIVEAAAQIQDQTLRETERKGEMFGQIKLLQKLLDLPQSTREELAGYDEVQLNELSERLQHQLRDRRA